MGSRDPAHGAGMERLRVLIVDDDPALREILAIALRDRDFEVTETSSSLDALELATLQKFDVAILDLDMPEMNGFELAEAIHMRRPLPLIALTGRSQRADFKRTASAGFALHLVKPVTIELLVRSIETAVLTGMSS